VDVREDVDGEDPPHAVEVHLCGQGEPAVLDGVRQLVQVG
jgi:hypothetical protein